MSVARAGLWLRWSLRDLRARALQVAAIAAIVALGTGVYAGLTSTSEWRRRSYDASYAQLAVHDVRITLARDTYVADDAFASAVRDAPDVAAVETRLIVPKQVDASHGGDAILVAGRLVGVETAGDGPTINRLFVTRGESAIATSGRALLDEHFVDHHELPASGRVALPGGRELQYDGAALSPEYFMVFSDDGTMLAEASFAVLFASKATVQELAGRPGEVNDAVVHLAAGADRATAAERIATHLADALPGVAVTVTPIDEDRSYRTLYDDIDGDQRLYSIFAFMILGGAAFAAFNLVGRIVEAQRREIGIGMALGMPRRQLAIRPLLVGFEVSILGALFGIGVATFVASMMRSILVEFFPLPDWQTPFVAAVYARGLALGIVLPFVATVIPVLRAVRVEPVAAIHTGPAAAKRSGLAPLLRRISAGDTLRLMPVRNVVRAPRRTLLTTLAIAAAIGTLVGVIGMVDSFIYTIDRGESAVLGTQPDRLTVDLEGFALRDSPALAAVSGLDGVAAAEPALRIGGTLLDPSGEDADDIEVLLRLVDLESDQSRPGIGSGALDIDGAGVVIARKAADDLGVEVGDPIVLRHPFREGTGYRWVESSLPVEAIHDIPYRFVAYMDLDDAAMMDLDGIYNSVTVHPEPGVAATDVQRALFETAGVASVQPVRIFADTIRDTVNEFLDILNVIRGAVLLLAVLIAFNATAINVDERAREHATMFAFGVPLRTVLRSIVVESLIVGTFGSLVGVAVGRLVVAYVTGVMLPDTLPDIGVSASIAPATVATALVLGVVAVSLAPLLTVRRLRRMDIPSTLRVVE